MLEGLMKQFEQEKNKLIDKLTLNLIEVAGFELSKDYSQFELLMLMDAMSGAGYKIRHDKSSENERIFLNKGSDILCGYDITIVSGDLYVGFNVEYFGN